MWKQILEALKKLYLIIQCMICCRSACSLEVGTQTDEHQDKEEKEE